LFPSELVKSVSSPPGTGGELTIMTYTINAPPPPVDQNAAWQEVNRQLNTNLKLPLINLQDYNTKLNVVISGGELPDVMRMTTLQASSTSWASARRSQLVRDWRSGGGDQIRAEYQAALQRLSP
jgi:ABC-type glycerol-3-phosphate transport system substrate-binding protein